MLPPDASSASPTPLTPLTPPQNTTARPPLTHISIDATGSIKVLGTTKFVTHYHGMELTPGSLTHEELLSINETIKCMKESGLFDTNAFKNSRITALKNIKPDSFDVQNDNDTTHVTGTKAEAMFATAQRVAPVVNACIQRMVAQAAARAQAQTEQRGGHLPQTTATPASRQIPQSRLQQDQARAKAEVEADFLVQQTAVRQKHERLHSAPEILEAEMTQLLQEQAHTRAAIQRRHNGQIERATANEATRSPSNDLFATPSPERQFAVQPWNHPATFSQQPSAAAQPGATQRNIPLQQAHTEEIDALQEQHMWQQTEVQVRHERQHDWPQSRQFNMDTEMASLIATQKREMKAVVDRQKRELQAEALEGRLPPPRDDETLGDIPVVDRR